MKSRIASLALICTFAAAPLALADQIVEIPLQGVMAPSLGFDDNDNIQIVVHGQLANACYTLSNYHLEPVTVTQFRVHQYANRLTDGYCADETKMPAHLKMPVPFTTEISMGQMRALNYQFQYLHSSGQSRIRNLNVARAKAPTVDELPYASVTSVSGSVVTNGAEPITVTINGILNSSCTRLAGVRAERVEDTFVVLPTIRVKPNTFCADVITPFSYQMQLGHAPSGHYLVHVRSMNGRGLNHVTEVVRH